MLVLSAAAPARSAIDVPFGDSEGVPKYHMTVTVASGEPARLVRQAKGRCEALGPARCKIVRYTPPGTNYGDEDASIKLVLASGTASMFMSVISKTSGDAGININRNRQASSSSRDELELERELLQVQLDKLAELTNANRSSVITARRAKIEDSLERAERQLSRLRAQSEADILEVRFDVLESQQSSRLNRQLEELVPVFVIGFLAVTGAALLTALYFGILGIGFLWLRKIATRRGLLKGGAAGPA